MTNIETLIVRTPPIRGGRPRIAGTSVTVMRIARWYKMGWTAEEIVSHLPHLPLAGVYAALAYYHANREEIEQEIADEAIAYEQWEEELARQPAGVR